MRATIEDVAKDAGVSVATVSRALRGMAHVADATRSRVVESATRLGYAPHFGASVLAGGTTRSIGLVAPYFDIWYTSSVLAGVEKVLSDAGHDLVIFAVDTAANRARFVSRAPSLVTRLDGLLMVDFVADESELDRLVDSGLNLVSVGKVRDDVTSIAIDNVAAAYTATCHLIQQGHKQIAVAGAQQIEIDSSPVLVDRLAGYRAALSDGGVEERPEYSLAGHLSVAGGAAAIQSIIELECPPTAAFFFSDEMAMGALAEARRLGVDVPEDLAVIGFDDHDLSDAAGLSTMRQPVRQIGSLAAQQMLSLTELVTEPAHQMVAVELVERVSSAVPAGRV